MRTYNSSPKFIVLDGIDGCGKTTQARALIEYFYEHRIPYRSTQEPTGTIKALLADNDTEIDPYSETEILFYDRREHLKTHILPWLTSGCMVICDRFSSSTYAYQGAKGVPASMIKRLDDRLPIHPYLTFILDLPPVLAMHRVQARNDKEQRPYDKTELLPISFFERVRANYIHLAESEPTQYILVNANQPPEQVTQDILKYLR